MTSAAPPARIRSVAIVGGGFSGALLAINLARHGGPSTVLVEKRANFGAGVAYDAANVAHLLNVRAGNMSALPDQPAHFAEWLAGQGGDPAGFAPRRMYGAYLAGLLTQAAAAAGERLMLKPGHVVGIQPGARGVLLRLADGSAIAADVAVLAMGNLPPHPPAGLDPQSLGPDLFVNDPWARSPERGLTDADTVLLVGTGLTMVDVAISLVDSGFGGRLVALSRRGLLPREHAPTAAPPPLTARPRGGPTGLLRSVRTDAATLGWRGAVDRLRPHTQDLWRGAAPAEQRRFLRHLRPWWDVHRHRLAPDVAARIAGFVAEGRLEIAAGHPLAFAARDGGVDATWRPRGADAPETRHVRRVINCTGPLGDLGRSTDPLLVSLIDAGLARPDAHRLGLDVDPDCRLIGADGAPHARLRAVGPMTRGAFWEITAVPDIRLQVWDLARRLSHAHWVEGDGL